MNSNTMNKHNVQISEMNGVNLSKTLQMSVTFRHFPSETVRHIQFLHMKVENVMPGQHTECSLQHSWS
jgi:hypothetical protein